MSQAATDCTPREQMPILRVCSGVCTGACGRACQDSGGSIVQSLLQGGRSWPSLPSSIVVPSGTPPTVVKADRCAQCPNQTWVGCICPY